MALKKEYTDAFNSVILFFYFLKNLKQMAKFNYVFYILVCWLYCSLYFACA